MPWVRLEDGFPENPKVLAAGDEAAWLYVCALAYCNRHLTDGFVPSAAVKRLTGHKSPIRLAMKLVDVGLLERDDDREGFVIHDYLNYQPSKASVETDRAGARERMANARRSSKDVRPNKPRSSPNPNPNPTQPIPESSSSPTGSSNGRHRDDDDDRIVHAIEIHAAWASRTADSPKRYARTVAANDRRDSVPDLLRQVELDPAVTAEQLATAVFGMNSVDVRTYDPRRT